MPPDPSNKDKFDNFAHTFICLFGIQTHDKTTTGRCHKPPKGNTRCSLTKPSGLIDRIKPVQLIDITTLPINSSQKFIMKDCHQWCEQGVFDMTGRPRGATK